MRSNGEPWRSLGEGCSQQRDSTGQDPGAVLAWCVLETSGNWRQQDKVVEVEGSKLEVSRGWGFLQEEKVPKNGMISLTDILKRHGSCFLECKL